MNREELDGIGRVFVWTGVDKRLIGGGAIFGKIDKVLGCGDFIFWCV